MTKVEWTAIGLRIKTRLKQVEVTCYKCRMKGHYASECKNKKLKDVAYYEKKLEEAKKQQLALVTTDNWLSDSSDDEKDMANFCLMAKDTNPESTSDKDNEVICSTENIELQNLKYLFFGLKKAQLDRQIEKSDNLSKELSENSIIHEKDILQIKNLENEILSQNARISFYEKERQSLHKQVSDNEVKVKGFQQAKDFIDYIESKPRNYGQGLGFIRGTKPSSKTIFCKSISRKI